MQIRHAARFLVPLVAAAQLGCASQRQSGWLSADNASNSGNSNSGNSDSGNSNNGNTSASDNSGSSDGPSSESRTAGSSDTHSATSGNVTTQGDQAANSKNGAVLISVGLTLIGLAATGVTTLMHPKVKQAFLDEHARDIRLALARGEGAFVRDVGHNLGITPRELGHLGDVLRGARGELEPRMRDADAFATALVRALLSDPELAPRAERLMQVVAAQQG